ncbi:unnamed protein product [Ostreobium quekettii]|uniref:Uncharacterized protein n=1 Tax=Ostreobium quekettii TaxID=121088 RepID=A0A8S1IP47_9CHLO|nr:unnamed protein product [Ostreobium quekettii]
MRDVKSKKEKSEYVLCQFERCGKLRGDGAVGLGGDDKMRLPEWLALEAASCTAIDVFDCDTFLIAGRLLDTVVVYCVIGREGQVSSLPVPYLGAKMGSFFMWLYLSCLQRMFRSWGCQHQRDRESFWLEGSALEKLM